MGVVHIAKVFAHGKPVVSPTVKEAYLQWRIRVERLFAAARR